MESQKVSFLLTVFYLWWSKLGLQFFHSFIESLKCRSLNPPHTHAHEISFQDIYHSFFFFLLHSIVIKYIMSSLCNMIHTYTVHWIYMRNIIFPFRIAINMINCDIYVSITLRGSGSEWVMRVFVESLIDNKLILIMGIMTKVSGLNVPKNYFRFIEVL